MEDLTRRAIETVVEKGFLRQLYIFYKPQDGDDVFCRQLVDPCISVQSLKRQVCQILGVPESEQRLIHKSKEIFYGPLYQQRSLQSSSGVCPTTLVIRMYSVPWDPRELALYESLGLDKWHDRDEILARLAMRRLPHRCYCGHSLTMVTMPELRGLGLNCDEQSQNPIMCTQCGACQWYPRYSMALYDYHACIKCRQSNALGARFCLCYSCKSADQGGCIDGIFYEDNPRAGLLQNHMLLLSKHSAISYTEQIGTQTAPEFHACDNQRLMLPRGIRLVRRFDPVCKEILIAAELGQELANLEIDQILENGATETGMRDLLWDWKASTVYQNVLFPLLQQRQQTLPGYWNLPGYWKNTLTRVSINLEEIVYHMSVGYYLVDTDDY